MTQKDSLLKNFQELEISKGDTILVHSDISKLKTLQPQKTKISHCQFLLDTLCEAIGKDGTLLIPTFTYKFCSTGMYDPLRSKSEIGIFPNFTLTQPDFSRSVHPVFSFSIKGKNKSYFMQNISPSGFGHGSIFERLHKKNAKILFFNASFQSCTFVHHIEEMHGIDYRYIKRFKGKIKVNGLMEECYADNMVRRLDGSIITDLSNFENDLLKSGKLFSQETKFGKNLITTCNDLYLEGISKLSNNPSYFLKV